MAAVITGIGAVSAMGRGIAALWSGMLEGRDGIAPIRRFDARAIGVELAGLVPDRNLPEHHGPAWVACVEFAVEAAREAMTRACLQGLDPGRIALVVGSSLGDAEIPTHQITERIGDALEVRGPRLTISTACTSSTNALGLALDLLELGAADAVIAGGADVLTPLLVAGFHALGVLAVAKCAPFSEPVGVSLGEGAGFVVLERAEAAARRGAAGRLALLGYGLSGDAFHDTGPDPTGAGVARGIRAALEHAGVSPDEVHYVNAHGTGTQANDPAEWRAIQHVFGRRADSLPVSSSKSFLGHAQGAAGVLETIATIVALEQGSLPPTQRYTTPRPNSPRDAIGQATPRRAECPIAVCTNSAFGGANCAVVIGRAERPAPVVAPRRVFVAGLGAVGPHGIALADLRAARARGRTCAFRLEDILPSADPRGLDPSTRYLIAAGALALADCGGARLRGDARDRTGLVVGVTVASPESDTALDVTIEQRGYRGLSASLFSRLVLNAPAGTCSRVLGVRGATSTISAGPATGLVAMAYAAELLARHADCDRILAAGLDELPAGDVPEHASDGAACAVLSTTPSPIRVAGWSLAGPGQLEAATRDALAQARLDGVDVVVGPRTPADLVGDSPAFTSAIGLVVGSLILRAHEARSVLVTQSGGASADCAIVLVAHEGGADAT